MLGYRVLPKNTTISVAHQAGAYPGFCSIEQLGILLLPP